MKINARDPGVFSFPIFAIFFLFLDLLLCFWLKKTPDSAGKLNPAQSVRSE